MKNLNPQAVDLNNIIQKNNGCVFSMLSERGKEIFFPKKGILSQSADAKGKKINATIGIALEETGIPMVLTGLKNMINCPNPEDMFTYAPSFGNPDIRKIWLEKIIQKNPSLKGKILSSPTVTIALTHGLSISGYLFANENDNVISPDFYWENYDLIFSNAYGASIETFKTFKNNAFNLEGFKNIILNHKSEKLILILNFPNNPTGYTVSESEALSIKQILIEAANAGKKLVCLIDDAYFGLVYEEGIFKESLFTLLCDAHENILAVKVDGPTKEDYVWGFRVGFLTYGVKNGNAELYAALENKTGGAIRGNISNAPNTSQTFLANVYKNADYNNQKIEKFNTLMARYNKVKSIIQNHDEYKNYFEAVPFNSGYFMCIELKKHDAETIRQILLNKYSVGVIAQGKLLRIAFSATPLNQIETLFDSIYKACME